MKSKNRNELIGNYLLRIRYVNTFKHQNQYYLINCNNKNVTVYGMDKQNHIIGTFSEQSAYHYSAFVKFYKGIETLFESDNKGNVRLWDYEKKTMISKISCSGCEFRGIILWNQKYIIASSSDNSIKILDIEKQKFVQSLSGQHTKIVCCVRKIIHPKYGESLLSGSKDGSIKLWTI